MKSNHTARRPDTVHLPTGFGMQLDDWHRSQQTSFGKVTVYENDPIGQHGNMWKQWVESICDFGNTYALDT